MDSNEFLSPDGNPLFGSALPDDPLLKGISSSIEDQSLFGTQKSRKDSAYSNPLNEELKPLWVEEAEENERTAENPKISPLPMLRNFPYSSGNYSDSLPLNIDPLTGTTPTSPLASSEVIITQNRSPFPPGENSAALGEAPKNTTSTSQTTLSPSLPPTWAIQAEGTVTVNGGGDFDGEATNPADDALIYAGSGFTLNGKMVLPVKRDAAGNPILDSNNQPILVDKAVAVAAGYRFANVSGGNRYSGLEPPQIVEKQTVDVPAYNTLKTQELNSQIPSGTTSVSFKVGSKPLNNATQWNQNFPSPGTASNPKVVKITGGGLTIPTNVNLSNYVLIVESGDLNFNGSGHNLSNVVLVTNNGNINLSSIQATKVTVLSAGSINTNGGARFASRSLMASGGSITFNGSTKTTADSDALRAIAGGNITYNGSADTRGHFLAKSDFTFNGRSTLIGSIGTKNHIIFNGGVTVIGAANPFDNSAPTDLLLNPNSIKENVPINTVIGNFSTLDSDSSDSHLYTLVSGTGATDNAAFTIDGNQLRLNNSPDFEAKNNYSIRVRSTDVGGLSVEKVFPVSITNVNEAPTLITLSNNSVAEKANAGTVIGQLSTIDPDAGDTHTYELTDNASGRFQLVGDLIQVAPDALLDFETHNSFSIAVRSTDAMGLSKTRQFIISLTNINEVPTNLTLNPNTSAENVPNNSIVGNFRTSDPDAGDSHTYTLVAGDGDTDNAAFSIVGNQLQLKNSPDFEAKNRYDIRVRTTDAGSLSVEKILTVSITNVNEAPTHITLSNNAVDENAAANTVIGQLNTTDPDTGDNHTYTLIDDAQGRFSLSENRLQVAPGAILDFENNNSYTITVRSTDTAGLSQTQQFVISVTNVNEAPSFIVLNPNTLPENSLDNSVVGSLTTTDSDAGDVHTYNLVALVGDTDNAAFSIVGNELRLNNSPDFETQESYNIRLRTTDKDGLSLEKVLTVSITNVNEAPTRIILSNNTLPETSEAGTIIGQLSTTDPDRSDTHTYSLIDDAQGRFQLVGDLIQVASNVWLDFETQNSYLIEVRSTDAGGLSTTQKFTISLSNINEAPTHLALSSNTLAENVSELSVVGNFSTIDPDLGDSHTYTLVTGVGDADNTGFTIEGEQLRLNTSPNFEAQSSYSIRVRSTDASGLSIEKVFAVNITNLNEAPSFISLTNTVVTENADSGTLIGQFSTTDPDAGDSQTYTLVNNAEGRFQIVDNQLQVSPNAILDWETDSSYTIVVLCTDAGGLSATQAFTLTLTNVNEAPTNLILNSNTLTENVPNNTVVGSLTTIDPDDGDSHTYTLIAGEGDVDNVSFTLSENHLRLKASPDFEAKSTYRLRVRSTDAEGLSVEKVLTVNITNVNETPTLITLSEAQVPENTVAGTVIGQFSTTDPDPENSHLYTLVDDAGGTFQIVNNQLVVAPDAHLDFETQSSYTITVRSTDNGEPNLSREQSFTLNITNINKAPAFTSNPVINAEALQPYSYTITTTDLENQARSITASSLPNWLTLTDNGDGTATLGTPSVEQIGIYNLILTTTDAEGASSQQSFSISVDFILSEQTSFNRTTEVSLTIPGNPSLLKFKVNPISFDVTDPDSIKDAFEVDLVDSEGKSLVHTFDSSRQAFFNWTESTGYALAPGVTYSATEQTVTLNLTGIPANTNAKLIFRLVNNDSDTTTSVRLQDLAIVAAPNGTTVPIQDTFSPPTFSPLPITNLLNLEDVSPSLRAFYQRTSFERETQKLYAEMGIRNIGSYGINETLVVAVTNISDKSVRLLSPEGLTPDGLPYYNFSQLMAGGKLDPNEITATRDLVFSNPNQIQFTYDLIFLSIANRNPVIESNPLAPGQTTAEVVAGRTYRYDVQASDPDKDSLTYQLLVAPSGMEINASTGEIVWTPQNANKGNHAVLVEVSDSRGGSVQQAYTLSVIENFPNRPPRFISTPEVDAYINQLYKYDADATDPDNDALTYSLIIGPEGMKVHADTGEIKWTPPPSLVLGDTVLGRINSPGEVDEFTFSGTAGQQIYLDPLTYSGNYGDWHFDVYSPNGTKIVETNFYSFNNPFIPLTETGNYRLVVDTNGALTGIYGFSVIDPALIPIALFDTPIEGQLTPGSEDDIYRFTGNQGQKLFIDKISNSGSVNWLLYGPDNQVIGSHSSMEDLELILSTDGEYKLVLRGQSSFTSIVNYKLEIITPDEITLPMSLGSIEAPNTVSGEIKEKGEKDFYTFEASVGQKIYFDRLFLNSTYYNSHTVTILDPRGQAIFSRNFADGDSPDPIILNENGTYQVQIDAWGENTGSYSFNLLDLGLATPINFDTEYTNTLNPGRESHSYQFSGIEGQRLFIDSRLSSGGANWKLYNSALQPISNTSLGSDIEAILSKSETYFLLLQGNNDNPVSYKFEVITPDEITLPMSLGSIESPNSINGEIREKGEIDNYTFLGTVGQRIYFDRLFLNSTYYNSHTVNLIDPRGQTIFSRNFQGGDDPDPMILTENGTYRVQIDAEGENTGSYSFSLLDLGLAEPIDFDTQYTNTLNPGQETHFYQFSGTENQHLYFDTNGSTSNTNWTLYDSGNNLIHHVNFNNDIELILNQTDTYTLAIRGNNGANPVNYSFRIVTPDTIAKPLTLDSIVSGTIGEKGEQDGYTLTGSQGNWLFFDTLIENVNIQATLVSPKGLKAALNSQSFQRDGERHPFLFTEDGTYGLTIDGVGETTGNYSFKIADLSNAPLLPAETLREGTLTPGNSINFYQFTGARGERIYFDTQLNSSNANWHLYFNGSELQEVSLNTDFEYLLPAGGTYYLMLRGENANPVDYRIQRIVTTATLTSLTLNESVAGAIARLGEQKHYTFNGNFGQKLYFDSLEGNSFLTAVLLSPSGKQIYSSSLLSDSGPITLNESGTYQLIIDGQGDAIANYRFLLKDVATVLSLGESISVNLAPSETIWYQINGQAGQQLNFNSSTPSSTGEWIFYAPVTQSNGSLTISSNPLTSNFSQTLLYDGNSTFALRNTSDNPLSYSFQVNALSTAPVTNSGLDVYDGTIDYSTEVDDYFFTAKAGTLVYLNGSDNWTKLARLYAPDGSLIFQDLYSDAGVFQLRQTGTYNLEVYGYFYPTGKYIFQLLDLTNAPTIDFNTTTNFSLNFNEFKIYQFNGSFGQKVRLDCLNYPNASVKLFNASGRQIAVGGNIVNDLPLQTLEADGKYYLVFEPNSYNTSANTVSLRLLESTTATSIILNTEISGHFTPNEGEAKMYRFSGSAGQHLFFDSTQNNSSSYYDLYSSTGEHLFSQRNDLDSELTLPGDGEYTLVLTGLNSAYALRLLTSEWKTNTYTIGETLSGSEVKIGTPGERDSYTFWATSGQKLYFDSLQPSNPDIDWRLVAPSGREIFNSNVSEDQLITIAETGTYTLTVDGVGHAEYIYHVNQGVTGNYGFRVWDWDNLPLISLDTTVSGNFGANVWNTDLYRFSGTQGERIFFDRLIESGSGSQWGIYTDTGIALDWQESYYGGGGEFERILPYTGDYVVVLKGLGYPHYQFQLVTPERQTKPYTMGETISGADIQIGEAGERDTYTFAGTAGQRLYFDSLEDTTSHIDWSLVAPSGREVFNADARDDQLITLSETGTYTLTVDGVGYRFYGYPLEQDATGSYGFRIFDWAQLPLISFDTRLSGNFGTSKRETDLYRFKGNAGQKVFFNRLEGDDYNEWGLYTDKGVNLAWTRLGYAYGRGGDYELTLPDTGEYVVRLNGYGSSYNTYEFEMLPHEWQTQAYTIGSTVSGADVRIGKPGERDSYTFSGTAGQRLYFDSLEDTDGNIKWSFVAPSGREFFNTEVRNDQFITLTETGTYTLTVDGEGWNYHGYQQDRDITGSYGFRIFDWAQLPEISLDTRISGDFGAGKRETDLYRFSGNARQRVFFNRLDGDDYNEWGLYTDKGVNLVWTYLRHYGERSGDFELSLPDTGNYVLRLSGKGNNFINYAFEIVTPEWSTQTYTIGSTVSGADVAISEPGEKDSYTLSGTAGQRLYWDSLEATDSNIKWRLVAPSGREIFKANAQNDQFLALAETGIYTLVVDGVGYDSSGYQQYQDITGSYGFRIFDWAQLSEIHLDESVSGNFGTGKRETDLYTVKAIAGQRLLFNRTTGSYDNNWGLYNAKGVLISNWTRLGDDFAMTLPDTGDYVLRLSSDGHNDSTYTFEIISSQLLTSSLTLGQTVTNSISKGGEQDTYTFDGTAGGQLYFDARSGNANLKARLYSPSGKLVIDNHTANDWLPFTLTETGTYRLVVDGEGEATGNYSFILSDRSAAPAISFNSPVTGTLDSNNTQLYSLKGKVGQILHFDLDAPSWNSGNWVLYGNNNQILANYNTSSPDFTVTLPNSGLYTLALNSSNAVSYRFNVSNLTPNLVETTGLDTLIGETAFSSRQGTINAGQVVDQTFTASAGTRIYFDSKDFDDSHVMVTLINLNGTNVFSTSASNDVGIVQLGQTGTYTLRIAGASATSTGDYHFSLMEVLTQKPADRDNVRRLTLNAEITKPLEPGRTTDILSFEGKAGQILLYDGILPDGANFNYASIDARLIGPSGQTLFDLKQSDSPYNTAAARDFGPFVLGETGTYNLMIVGNQDSVADYRFKVLDFSAAYALPLNRVTADNFLRGSDTNLYKLQGVAGQRLYFDALAGRASDRWILYRANNAAELASANLDQDFEYILPDEGEYILAVRGGSTTPANYRFSVVSQKDPDAIVIPGVGETGGNSGEELGVYRVRLKVNDNSGGSDEQEFLLRVHPELGNADPVIISDPLTKSYINRRYTYDVDAVDADADNLTYALVEAPSGMVIDFSSGEITWNTPTFGTHRVRVRVMDTSGGRDFQTFDLVMNNADNGIVRGTVYNDLDNNGVRKLTNPNNLTPYDGVVIGERFANNYTAYNLGVPQGVPFNLGGMAFLPNNPDTLLIAGAIHSCGGVIFKTKVLRGDGGHIIGFDDDGNPDTPYVAEYYAYSSYVSASLTFTPDGQLLITYAQGAYSGLNFVPDGMAGAGQLKATGQYPGTGFYTLTSNGNGSYSHPLQATSLEVGLGAFVYRPVTAPGFETGAGILITNFQDNLVTAYQLDSMGNPISSTGEIFLNGFEKAMGAIVDPVTGDLLFSSAGAESNGKNTIIAVRGLGDPDESEPGLERILVYVDRDSDGVRDVGEESTYTDELGTYSFVLEPGTYQIRQEILPGWTQTTPLNPDYHLVTVVAHKTIYGVDFGNFGSPGDAPNVEPEMTSSPVTQVATEGRYLYHAKASDKNGDPLTYELIQKPEGMAVAPNGTISWRPSQNQVGSHQVLLKVSDGRGGVDLQSFEIEVDQGNRHPIITSIVPEINPQVGKQYRYQVTANDLDGDTLTYSLVSHSATPTGVSINATTGNLTWTPTTSQVGGAFQWGPDKDITAPWQVVVKVSDGKGGESFLSLDLLVEAPAPNRAPSITSAPRNSTRWGQLYLYEIEASDPDGDRLTYTLVNAPMGMTVENGVVSWKPTAAQTGSNNVVLRVSDGQATVEQSWTVDVSHQSINRPPSITSAPKLLTNVGDTYTYNLTGNDPDHDYRLWGLDSAPSGMVIDASTGALGWQPTDDQIGSHTVAVRLIDSLGSYSVQEYTLKVTGINAPPEIVSTPITRTGTGSAYTYSIMATDPEGDAITFNLGKKPVGMVIDPRTGQLSWTPTTAQIGSHQVEIQVIDSEGALGTQTYTLEVNTLMPNSAPSITSTPLFVAGVGSPYTYEVSASDPDGDRLTYQLIKAPSGMIIDAATGRVSWSNPVAGQYSVVVGVNDGTFGATQGFTLTAKVNSLPVIKSTLPPTTATPGDLYRYDVIASDPDGGRLTYRLDLSSIDKGISIDELGRLSWTPTTAQMGIHPLTITISDRAGATVEQNFSLEVKADAIAPVVSVGTTIQSVALGESVTAIVAAPDRVGVKFLNLTINGTPVPLDANGLYTFTPTTVGSVRAIATAIDAAGNQSTAETIFNIIDLSDVTAPIIQLPTLDGQTFTSPFEIVGTVTDDNLLYYTLSVAPVGTSDFRELWRGTNTVNQGVLGTFDPSLLENDAYTLRLMAIDAGGNEVYLDKTVNVEGELKLGNFQLSFTDLTLPVAGIPISVTRTYDTLTSNSRDEFGYGWRLEFRDTNLRTSLGRDATYEQFGLVSKGFKAGDKVYITLPGGKREAFTFAPEPDPLTAFLNYWGIETGFYHPKFVSQSGSYNTLTVSDVLLVNTPSGEFAGVAGNRYNPLDPYFGGQYTLTTKEGLVYEIDAVTGDLLTATDTNGNKLTFSDAGITSDSGVEVKFGRDAQGRITTIADPMNRVIRYEYDVKGDLVRVVDREENTTQFEYNSDRSHYLSKIIDPLNREAVRTEYTTDGRLKRIIDAEGDPVEFVYDPDNDIQITKDAFGNPTTYEYDERGNVVRVIDAEGHQIRMEYDDNNNLEKLTDANGLVTEYQYDDRGNLTFRTEQYCGCPTVTPGTTYYTYNQYGQTTSLVLPTGASMTMNYDSRGNLLSMKDGRGNIIQSITYDAVGRVISETDTSGTTYYGDYDRFGNARWMKDAFGQITTSTYNDNGLIETLIDNEGTSTFTYDKLGRETRADYGNGIWVEYGYTGSGGDWTTLDAPTIGHIERKFTDDGKLRGWVTPDGGTPTFYYDTAGRLWRETDAGGNVTTEYGYDKAGRLTTLKDVRTGAITTKKYDGGGRLIEEIDAFNGFTRSIYDERTGKLQQTERGQYIVDAATGKLVEDSTVHKQVWKYEYNGTRTTVIDPLERRTTSVLDEYYLPIETIYTTGQKTQISYLYDNNLQEAKDYPTQIVDIGGNDRNFTYNSLGRLRTATDLGKGTYTYDYGENGLRKITSPTGETLQYGYDELGNLAKVINGDGTFKQMSYRANDNRLGTIALPSGETITYDYYESGQIKSQTSSTTGTVSFTYTPEGAISTVTDSTGTTTYHYDPNTGAFSGIDYPNGSSISYTYDLLGRIKTVTEKGSATGTAYVTEYDYDAFGNLNWIKDPAGGVTRMTYDVVNHLKERILPNGVKTIYEYDDLDRVESIVHKNAQGEILASVTYEREGIGEPTKITREDGSYVKLEYDEALRVKKESYYNAAGTLLDETTYTYDAAGKRIAQSTGTGDRTYNYGSGYQLDTISESGETEDYDYDPNGRLTLIERDGKVLDLEHDTSDRLTAVENETTGETIQYIYDGQGRRIKAVEGTDERWFLVAPAMGSGLESTDLITDGSGNLISNYIYAEGSSPFMRLDENGNPIYYLTDAMGTVIGLANGTGTEVADFRYDSFGNLRGSSGSITDEAGGDFRFQGQWLESQSGLYYFRARDYDSKTGLFLSRDPVEIIETEPESFNPYQFVYGNPYVYSDPTGQFTITELSASQSLQTTLATVRQYVGAEAKDYILERLGDSFGNVVLSTFNAFLPGSTVYQDVLDGLSDFEDGLKGIVCQYFEGLPLKDNLFLEVKIHNGIPQNNGLNCSNYNQPPANPKIAKKLQNLPGSAPDFLFRNSPPLSYTAKDPGAYLIGDVKSYLGYVREEIPNSNQWKNMVEYAKNYQILPFVSYLAFSDSNILNPFDKNNNPKGLSKSEREKFAGIALSNGVILILGNLIDK